MDPHQALARSTACYARVLRQVAPHEWALASTCDGWTVKDLADHVLGGNRFAVALLAGRSAQDAYAAALEARFDGNPF